MGAGKFEIRLEIKVNADAGLSLQSVGQLDGEKLREECHVAVLRQNFCLFRKLPSLLLHTGLQLTTQGPSALWVGLVQSVEGHQLLCFSPHLLVVNINHT